MAAQGKVKDDWVSTGGAAAACGTSVRNFLRWGLEPAAMVGRKNYYKIADVIAHKEKQAYERGLKDGRERIEVSDGDKGEVTDPFLIKVRLDQQRARLTEAQAEHQEMKNQMMRHEIAPFGFFTFVLARAANSIASVMDGMPSELVRKLALKPQQVDKVRGVTAAASDAIASLGDEEWVAARYDEFLAETDQ